MSGAPADRLAGLTPEARRVVVQELLATTSRRVRDLLAAAGTDDRESVIRLATALGSDLAGLGLDDVRTAASELATSAGGAGPLGASAIALVRAYHAACARLPPPEPPDASS